MAIIFRALRAFAERLTNEVLLRLPHRQTASYRKRYCAPGMESFSTVVSTVRRETAAVRLCRTAVIAIIEDSDEVKHILRHLVKNGRSPPGLDPDRLN